ncbi:MAG: hypothetical protein U0269_02395 [Polyangiales bacterium]
MTAMLRARIVSVARALSPLLLAPAALLLLSCRTLSGALCALVALSLSIAPWTARSPRSIVRGAPWLFAVGFALIAVVRAPNGAAPDGARSRVVFLDGVTLSRLAPTNVVPEVDQLSMATHLLPLGDAIIDRRGASRLREAIRRVYLQHERDPAFVAMGSAMGDALLDRDAGRLYVVEPRRAADERPPAIIFLHGSGGSWKGYFALFARMAERERWIVVQPSFGFGNWSAPGGLDAIERARRYAVEQLHADADRIVLAGLSNGGLGIERALCDGTPKYRGIIAISSVLTVDRLRCDPRDLGWRATPALLVHGAIDDRISLEHFTSNASALEQLGFAVTRRTFEHEDHFLIFTQPEAVFDEIARWSRAVFTRRA